MNLIIKMSFVTIDNYLKNLGNMGTQPVVKTTPNGTQLHYCPLTGALILNIGGIAYFIDSHGKKDEAIYCMGEDNNKWWHYKDSWFCFIDLNGQSFFTKGDGTIVFAIDPVHTD